MVSKIGNMSQALKHHTVQAHLGCFVSLTMPLYLRISVFLLIIVSGWTPFCARIWLAGSCVENHSCCDVLRALVGVGGLVQMSYCGLSPQSLICNTLTSYASLHWWLPLPKGATLIEVDGSLGLWV